MNPYNYNPFENKERELRSEYDANRELVKACRSANKKIKNYNREHIGDMTVFNYGYACGAAMVFDQVANALEDYDLQAIESAIDLAME